MLTSLYFICRPIRLSRPRRASEGTADKQLLSRIRFCKVSFTSLNTGPSMLQIWVNFSQASISYSLSSQFRNREWWDSVWDIVSFAGFFIWLRSRFKSIFTWLHSRFKSIILDIFWKAGSLISPMLLQRRLSTRKARIPISESVGMEVSLFLEIESSSMIDSRPRNACECSARIRLLSRISFLIRKFLNAFRPICVVQFRYSKKIWNLEFKISSQNPTSTISLNLWS